MKWELWFSESQFSVAMFAQGHGNDAGGLEADARRIAVFEAETFEDAKHQKEEFLNGPKGFFKTRCSVP
jgi:hypothetical protein